MSRRWSALIVLVILCGATAIPVAPAQASGRHPYTLVIPGTFGGPSSYLDEPGIPLTSDGALIGAADTATRNKAYQACPSHLCADSYEQRAFAWRNGKLTDLGVPPGWSGSMVNQLNRFGVGAGSLERGFNRWMPPDNRLGHAAGVAALFKQGRVVELGTLPGGSLSFAQNIDSRGQVAGNSNNGTKDPFRPGATETRVFVWNHGAMKDIGTLGGPDTFISWQNGDGQIVGSSYTSYTPDPANYGAGALGGFLWQHGKMINLGNLGGTVTNASWINDRGEIVGQSNLAGDKMTRPFLWVNGRMTNLGSLGGSYAQARYISRQGDITGESALPGNKHFDAVLWRHGRKIALPRVGGAPDAFGVRVNDHGDVVGYETNAHNKDIMATLWTSDRRGYDLNKLVAPSNLRMIAADYIDDTGEIVGHGVYTSGPQQGDARIFLLTRNPSVPLPRAQTPTRLSTTAAPQNPTLVSHPPIAPTNGANPLLGTDGLTLNLRR